MVIANNGTEMEETGVGQVGDSGCENEKQTAGEYDFKKIWRLISGPLCSI